MQSRYRIYLVAKGQKGNIHFKFKIGSTDNKKVALKLAKENLGLIKWLNDGKDYVLINVYQEVGVFPPRLLCSLKSRKMSQRILSS